MCDKEFIWNPSHCECGCNKLCGVAEYLDYKNCKCRNRLIDKLVEKCNKNIDENEMIYNGIWMQFHWMIMEKYAILYNIHCTINNIFHNKYKH